MRPQYRPHVVRVPDDMAALGYDGIDLAGTALFDPL